MDNLKYLTIDLLLVGQYHWIVTFFHNIKKNHFTCLIFCPVLKKIRLAISKTNDFSPLPSITRKEKKGKGKKRNVQSLIVVPYSLLLLKNKC